MQKVIFLAGVPCSGKTTIFKKIREKLFSKSVALKHKTLRYIKSESEYGNYFMLGVFDNSNFEGTDRLSMSVINDALDFIKILERDNKRNVVFVEGDRLFNRRFLSETNAELYLLRADPALVSIRHKQRADTQSERFMRSRSTKIENLSKEFDLKLIINNTSTDLELAACRLCSAANNFLIK